ncbi:hypothetical protein BpHYR1_008582 [Brachionus plicatilis]|uniref:Uncharacterized protein n=1 Tax=Brachionus plicatilis TaxID=10195 RepID=A0A3M7P491_BRAPC|nr:hypothetical protein BpHYR1_008582 [Brachionus plicatilis]
MTKKNHKNLPNISLYCFIENIKNLNIFNSPLTKINMTTIMTAWNRIAPWGINNNNTSIALV